MPDGTTPSPSAAIPRVRKMGFGFDEVPRRWFFDNVFVTAKANALNMLFPAGERFFVRSVKHYLPRIEDPTLRARVRAFFGQEGSHGHEHERAFEILEAQGYEIREWLDWYQRFAFQVLEGSVPPALRLSITVALEHFTAALAESALTGQFLDNAHPAMQQLLRWHAAEEIEHKSVAFDVMQQVAPSYALRIAGLFIAAVALMSFWHSGTKMLLAQEEGYTKQQQRRDKAAVQEMRRDHKVLAAALLAYLRPGFHPDDRDNGPLARQYLQEIGRLEG